MTPSNADIQEHRQQSYELWQQMAGRWERRRKTLWEPSRRVSEWLVDQLAPAPGQTILDVAAGTGETGFLAAARLGDGGRVISSDFAPQMVKAAERVAQELEISNVEFRVLDAEDMELEDASVDGVVCRWGYMLMGDPAAALRETRRVLRVGGRLTFSVWGEPERNPWMTVPGGVMVQRGHLPRRDPDDPGMFRMRDPGTVVSLLAGAGFAESEVEEMTVSYRFDDTDDLWTFASELQGPIALAIDKLDEHERRAVRSAIEERAAAFRVGNGYELPGLSLNVLAF